MKISIIIPCKNEAGVVEHLLEALTRQSRVADEIIVVDSHSTDTTVERSQQYANKLPLTIIKADKPGAAHARNAGAAVATGDMLIFMDADLIPDAEFLADFEAQVTKHLFAAGSFTQQMKSKKMTIRLGASFMVGYMRLMAHTPWPIGFSCLYATRQAFQTINGFDPELFIMEDYDFVLKAKRAGYKIGIIKTNCQSSDRRYREQDFKQGLRGIYGELYRYTHGLRITKPIYRYDMGGGTTTDTEKDSTS